MISWFDSAHNPDGAKTLVQTLNELYPNSSFGFILGFLKDKDSYGFMNEIKDIAEKSWFVDMDMHRGQSASISKKIGDRILKNTETSLFSDAIDKSSKWALKNNGLIVITGSIRLAEIIIDEDLNFNIF